MTLFETTVFITAFLFVFVGVFGLIFTLIVASNEASLRAVAELRTQGLPATVLIKGFRRISMTQHRVLCEVRLAAGAVGREYVLVGLQNDWLAHYAGLGQPVAAFVSHNLSAILLADHPSPRVVSRGESIRRVVLTMLGLFVACLALGLTMAFVMQSLR
jgi:hypothetical protein